MADYKYTSADFKSDQEVRWCPGCGDHAILNAVQRALPEVADRTDTPHNLFTFVSGIGCSSRFIYYMKTFGFHSVHGRANAVATGVKVANPRLNVWVTTGDGDSLAIGGNHFIHAIRRNVDLNVILFNNEIYGLTKGQYSPTSKLGKITKTSPYGTVEKPFNPGELVIGAKGTFFARSIDMEVNLSKECMVAAALHKGMSVVEVLQNCVIFNDKTHAAFAADKATRAERTITLRHGEKMLFGANNEKGLVFENMKLKVVTVGQDGYTLDRVLTHDAHERDTTLHSMLAAMKYPDYPVAVGVIRAVEDDAVYDLAVERQVEEVKATSKSGASTICCGPAPPGRYSVCCPSSRCAWAETSGFRRSSPFSHIPLPGLHADFPQFRPGRAVDPRHSAAIFRIRPTFIRFLFGFSKIRFTFALATGD